jgi:hypothetical protein
LKDKMSIPKNDDEHQLDTVPPPPGEDDAYSAATKIGQVPDDVLQAIKRAQANEAALRKLPPEDGKGAKVEAKAAPPPPPEPALEWNDEDDEDDKDDEAATMISFAPSSTPDVVGENRAPPRDIFPSAPDGIPPSSIPTNIHIAPDPVVTTATSEPPPPPSSVEPAFTFGGKPATSPSGYPPAASGGYAPALAPARSASNGRTLAIILAALATVSAILWMVLR